MMVEFLLIPIAVGVVGSFLFQLILERSNAVAIAIVRLFTLLLKSPAREERREEFEALVIYTNGNAWKIITALGLIRPILKIRSNEQKNIKSKLGYSVILGILSILFVLPWLTVLCVLAKTLPGISLRKLPYRCFDGTIIYLYEIVNVSKTDQDLGYLARAILLYDQNRLPWIWHLARGEMSLVGPFPDPMVDETVSMQQGGLPIKPGLIGLRLHHPIFEGSLAKEAAYYNANRNVSFVVRNIIRNFRETSPYRRKGGPFRR